MDIEGLKQPLHPDHVKQRKQGGRGVSYIEGWHAIAEANRLFGYGGWTRETVMCECVSASERAIGSAKEPGHSVTYTARVRVTVFVDGVSIVREGSGAGHGIGKDLGECHESAIKEAETDAMKRALMTFGSPFGLALYDKEQREVREPEGDLEARMINAIKGARSIPALDGIKYGGDFRTDFANLSEEGKANVTKAGTDQRNKLEAAAREAGDKAAAA